MDFSKGKEVVYDICGILYVIGVILYVIGVIY